MLMQTYFKLMSLYQQTACYGAHGAELMCVVQLLVNISPYNSKF